MLNIKDLHVSIEGKKILNGLNLSINKGEVHALMGPNGSGKSTLSYFLSGKDGYEIEKGSIDYNGKNLLDLEVDERANEGLFLAFQYPMEIPGVQTSFFLKTAINSKRKYQIDKSRGQVQMIFQDPYSSLNPRFKVRDIISEPIKLFQKNISSSELTKNLYDLIDIVGMSRQSLDRYPHEFSGGQRQRISIARALATRPRLLICDEPTSALDVSIQAQVLNLLKDIQDELHLAMLFISHDLPVIRQMCNRIVVLKDGVVCETKESEELFNNPEHPYTQELIRLMPKIESII